MGKKFTVKDKTIAEQLSAIRSKYPKFETAFVSHSGLKVTGALQPTSRSVSYNFILKYNLPPETVANSALPLPFLISADKALKSYLPAIT